MRRDMDLVRLILLETEGRSRPFDSAELADEGHSSDEIAYHVRIMKQAGLLDAILSSDLSLNYSATVVGLTWDGQDFLDAVRNDGVWQKIKRGLRDGVKSVGFDSIKKVAVSLGTAALEAQLGL